VARTVESLGYGPDVRDRLPAERVKVFFLFAEASRPVLGPCQHPVKCLPGAFSFGVKRPGCEADHSPLPNAEVKNAWSYTSILLYVHLLCTGLAVLSCLCFVKLQKSKRTLRYVTLLRTA